VLGMCGGRPIGAPIMCGRPDWLAIKLDIVL